MEDLDLILLRDLHQSKKHLKNVKRLQKMMNEPKLYEIEIQIHKKMNYLEFYIQDKTLLTKKIKFPKAKSGDILSKGIWIDIYKYWYYNSMYVCWIVIDSIYWPLTKRKSNEKSNVE